MRLTWLWGGIPSRVLVSRGVADPAPFPPDLSPIRMPPSFALRIESGEQAGQTHAIPSKGLTVGRRPGNDLVIQDASVSGRHARFSLEGDSVVLVDLASTNGSFVDDAKIEQATLQAGAFLRLGKVELELVAVDDGADSSSPPASTPAAAPAPSAMPAVQPPRPKAAAPPVAQDDEIELELEDDDLVLEDNSGPVVEEAAPEPQETLDLSDFDDDQDGVHAVDEDALAKTKGSKAPALVGLALIAGAAGWYFLGMPGLPQGDDPGAGAARPVAEVPGNALDDPSFEAGLTRWDVAESFGLVPFADGAWRASGEQGVGTTLEAGERARLLSSPINVTTQRLLTAGVAVTVEDGASARLGVAFADSTGMHAETLAWSAPIQDTDGDIELIVWAPAGYDRARVVLDMSAPDAAGSAGFDDASLVPASGAAPGGTVGDFVLTSAGDGRMALGFIDRPLLLDVRGSGPRAEGGELVLTAERGFGAMITDIEMEGGMATLGAGGFAPHGDDFVDAGVTALVIGQGVNQLLVKLPGPATVSGRPVLGGFLVEAADVRGAVRIATGFADERARAARLASEAQNFEERGQRGAALASWQALLDEVPFDAELVATAEGNRGRLITAGLEDLAALEDDYERATFFGLVDLFRECLDEVSALQDEFTGSEVAAEAEALAGQVRARIASFDVESVREERLEETRAAIQAWASEHGQAALVDHLNAATEGGN